MNTDTSGIADVWNASCVDKGLSPWADLTPEEQASSAASLETPGPAMSAGNWRQARAR